MGDTIPLVFANQNDIGPTVGGIRVNGQLLWSQLLSLGRLQQLKAIVMFSLGKIDVRPDFAGYAQSRAQIIPINSSGGPNPVGEQPITPITSVGRIGQVTVTTS